METVASTVPHNSVVKEVICKNCDATLQYIPSELKERKFNEYIVDCDIIKFINCAPLVGNKLL